MVDKFTPGPWSTNEWPQKDNSICVGSKGTALIASVELRDVSVNEQRANANLIAEAPKLLGALIPFLNAYIELSSDIEDSDLYDEQPKHICVTLGDIRKARAAIARATS